LINVCQLHKAVSRRGNGISKARRPLNQQQEGSGIWITPRGREPAAKEIPEKANYKGGRECLISEQRLLEEKCLLPVHEEM